MFICVKYRLTNTQINIFNMKHLHPRKIIRITKESLYNFFWYYLLPDKLYYKIQYRKVHGCQLNIKNPKSIDEKLQWIKLYDRKPIYHMMIDKVASKQFVEERLGTNEYTIPLLGVWNTFDEIDFDMLPKQFVLKCNHDSYSWIIVRDKQLLNKEAARIKLSKALKTNYYYTENKQWGYDSIPPRIMAEYYLAKEKLEYQIFCNNGIPIFFLVRSDLGDAKNGFNVCYDLDWNKVDYRKDKYPDIQLERPYNFDKMIEIAAILSRNTLHLRVDFYEMDGKLYIGELTFYSNGGDFHNFSEEGKQRLTETLTLPLRK